MTRDEIIALIVLEMRPSASAHDSADGGLRDTKGAREIAVSLPGRGSCADRQDGIVGEPRRSVGFSRCPVFSSAHLGRHIAHVIEVRPQEQMVRTDARRIIASVKHSYAYRDRTSMQFPRDAVCPIDLTVPTTKGSVAAGVLCPQPDPTRAKLRTVLRNWPILVDLFPEAISKWAACSKLVRHRATPRCRPRPLTRLRGLSAVGIVP